jgi:hypothetical protein
MSEKLIAELRAEARKHTDSKSPYYKGYRIGLLDAADKLEAELAAIAAEWRTEAAKTDGVTYNGLNGCVIERGAVLRRCADRLGWGGPIKAAYF